MSASIKLRTSMRDGVLTVRMLIRHALEVGGRRENGERVAPHFIKDVTCRLNGRVVLQGHWGGGIAKNPYLSFSVENAAAGDELSVRWVDNQGGVDEIATRV